MQGYFEMDPNSGFLSLNLKSKLMGLVNIGFKKLGDFELCV